jgi:hypothetical protein
MFGVTITYYACKKCYGYKSILPAFAAKYAVCGAWDTRVVAKIATALLSLKKRQGITFCAKKLKNTPHIKC